MDNTNEHFDGLWIARDEDGYLYMYWGKPNLHKPEGRKGTFFHNEKRCVRLGMDMYPEITYQNSPQPLITPITDNN